MTPEELKEIEERCNKATPNPTLTRYDHGGGRSYVSLPSGGVDLVAEYYGEGPDREFYYHSREDIPKLLSYIKELESRLPRWISKKERLPEKEGIYLVYEPWVYGVNALWFVLGMDGLPNSTTKKEWETVTHWHPLPKGPEE